MTEDCSLHCAGPGAGSADSMPDTSPPTASSPREASRWTPRWPRVSSASRGGGRGGGTSQPAAAASGITTGQAYRGPPPSSTAPPSTLGVAWHLRRASGWVLARLLARPSRRNACASRPGAPTPGAGDTRWTPAPAAAAAPPPMAAAATTVAATASRGCRVSRLRPLSARQVGRGEDEAAAGGRKRARRWACRRAPASHSRATALTQQTHSTAVRSGAQPTRRHPPSLAGAGATAAASLLLRRHW